VCIVRIDGRDYTLQIRQQVEQSPESPRLIVVAYQPNEQAQEVLRVCIRAVQHFTQEPHELWIVDNNSPNNNAEWLLDFPEINVVLNHTEPLPPDKRSPWQRLLKRKQYNYGSYANAIGLEIGRRMIDPDTHYLMTLHMDTMPCHRNWLAYLKSKINDKVRATGVRMDTARTPEGVLHVLGYLVDFQVFQQLDLDFLPEHPRYDVGDRVTVGLRKAGYGVYACPNSLWNPELLESLPVDSPFRLFYMDRSFDDAGNVIFLHLGRGVRKSFGKEIKGTSPTEWVRFAEQYLFGTAS
jgi:hypothetical protein